jgi:isoleucyl-tRNA synthetase
MLARCRELVEKVSGPDGKSGWYGDFQFHRVYHAVNEFCIVDLSAFYLDVLKDRLYTFAPQSIERRSAQTVLWRITEALVRLVAPILTFTADEVWQYLPHVPDRPASVHLALFPRTESLGSTLDVQEDFIWKLFAELRSDSLQKLETERQAKRIGKSLEARVILYTAKGEPTILRTTESQGALKELLNVSNVELKDADKVPLERAGKYYESHGIWLTIEVCPAEGHKCDRCWNYYADNSPQAVGQFGPWPNVCGRCADALTQMGYSSGEAR